MPVNRTFDETIPFQEGVSDEGEQYWLPIVSVSLLVPPSDHRMRIPLLFDTGASQVMLRKELYPFLGLLSWDVGERIEADRLGSDEPAVAYRYDARFELFGKIVECPVHLVTIPEHPLYQGLLGREQMFDAFGFGFWEIRRELYVTSTP